MSILENKVAIVTGATQGIGAAYVRGLAAAGRQHMRCLDPAALVKEIIDAGS